MEAREIKAPVPPGDLPAAVVAKWQATYEAAYKEAQNDEPEASAGAWQHIALREANKTLKFADPTNHAEATALQDWQVIQREVKDGFLRVVTRHGKGFRFAVPPKSSGSGASQNGGGKPDAAKDAGAKKE